MLSRFDNAREAVLLYLTGGIAGCTLQPGLSRRPAAWVGRKAVYAFDRNFRPGD